MKSEVQKVSNGLRWERREHVTNCDRNRHMHTAAQPKRQQNSGEQMGKRAGYVLSQENHKRTFGRERREAALRRGSGVSQSSKAR